MRAGLEVGVGESPAEPRFCAADGRQIEFDAGVAGQAEAAGMGDSMAVEQQQIRGLGKFGHNRPHGRQFTEGQIAGQVREVNAGCGQFAFDYLQVRDRNHAGRPPGAFATRFEMYVDSGHPAGGSRERLDADPVTQAFLQGPGPGQPGTVSA